MREIIRDAVGGVRLFRRYVGGVTTTVLSVAVALGLSASILSVLNSWLFPNVGVADPASLMWVNRVPRSTGNQRLAQGFWSYGDFLALRNHVTENSLAAVVYSVRDVRAAEGVSREDVHVGFVSGEFFQVVGARPSMGRLLDLSDELPGREPLVLSYDAWARMFGKTAAVLGTTVHVGSRPFEIVGVTEQSFTGPSRLDACAVWLPATALAPPGKRLETVGAFPLLLARLPTEGDEHRFRSQVSTAVNQSKEPREANQLELRSVLAPIQDTRGATVTPAVFGLIAALMAISVINLTGFLLIVASTRQQEIAARLALGATRGRLICQLLTETLMLGIVTAVFSLLAVRVFVPLLARLVELPVGLNLDPDWRMYAFLMPVTIAVSVVAAMAPVRHAAHVQLSAELSGDGSRRGWLPRLGRFRSTMIGIQVAISLVLLTTAVSLTRAASQTRGLDVGFDLRRLLALSGRAVGMDWSPDDAAQYWATAIARTGGLPGVESTALGLHMFAGGSERTGVSYLGESYQVALNRTSPDYFQTAGIRLLQGRVYSQLEVDEDVPVAVVSQKVARDLWGIDHAIGSTMTVGRQRSQIRVVGIVADVVGTDLLELSRPIGMVYRPLTKAFLPNAFLVIRARGNARELKREVEQVLPAFLDDRPPRLSRLETFLDDQIALVQIPSRIATLAGLTIVFLAAIGTQGLVALALQQRLKEIAVRMAVGAAPSAVVRHTASIALRPVVWGAVTGGAAAFVLLRALSTLLLGMTPLDITSLAVAMGIIMSAIAVAIASPIRRALRVNPLELLRNS